jgi:transcription antitermination factor NusG
VRSFFPVLLDLAELYPLPFSDTEFSFPDTPSWSDEPAWFAVHTRTRFEKKVAAQLEEKHLETFLPLFSAKHKWADRQQVVHEPLFPGYVFVHISPVTDNRIAVLRTIGVIHFVGHRGIGSPVPAPEIQAIKTVLEQRIPFLLYPYMNVGQRVRIRGGCFDGIEGILTGINSDDSLLISVQLIQRSIAMRITGYQIEPVGSARSAQSDTGTSQQPLASVHHDHSNQFDFRVPLRV